ncbi:hypothetical protein FNYG_14110 [Fusarium nygamai]|uniref:Uncharacterized protein n=1 Tax=Gibberella nygamai TaxID=42673 RepID=A0A2K0UTP7_GIBNY|nr:hypothetical protein FNYG_14110 [Fusarium nygamai]
MHPKEAEMVELEIGRGQKRRKRGKATLLAEHGSCLRRHHAEALASYIKDLFLDGQLLGEGVEPSWKLNGSQSQTLSYEKWTAFQKLFVEGWQGFCEQNSHDRFWSDHQPAFHAYDHGANIEIKVNGQLQALPKETRLRKASEDEESDSDSDVDSHAVAEDSDSDENEHRGSQESGLFVMGESGEDEGGGSTGPTGGSGAVGDAGGDDDEDGVESQRAVCPSTK